jgi:hypothetical protein
MAYGVPNSNSTLPTQSRQQGDSDLLTYAAENGPRVAGDDGIVRLTSGDGEGTIQWSSGSQDVRRSFLKLPSSFSTDQLLRTVAEKLEFDGYLGFSGFLTCGRKFALWATLYIGVFR